MTKSDQPLHAPSIANAFYAPTLLPAIEDHGDEMLLSMSINSQGLQQRFTRVFHGTGKAPASAQQIIAIDDEVGSHHRSRYPAGHGAVNVAGNSAWSLQSLDKTWNI